METREQRGLELLSNGKTPLLIDKETFKVPSQSGAGHYKVTHFDAWRCSCADYTNRKVLCKHIHATMFFLKMRNKVELQDFNIKEEINPRQDECPKCWSKKVIKTGQRKNISGAKQKFYCQTCGKYFVKEPIKYVKASPKIIVLTLDLYYKGLSLRDISDTIFQFYNQRIHFDTIRRWIQKFSKALNDYTTTLKPELSGEICTDEQFLKCKKKQIYAWNSIDKETRFILASTITKGRGVKDARKHFKELKKQTQDERPKIIHTDNLNKYPKAINKEFRTMKKETVHHPVERLQANINNNRIERYHNNFREFDKVRRTWKSTKSITNLANGHKIYLANLMLKAENTAWSGA
ncbi:MAG TPA: IS6 family transposase, partial [Candidatus Wunengus sp. YC61]|uniref:IS6 family transposase n=1 Tax=Candidatus Wunengus sp. YC61 TaxID=3367698 RepID=UPI004024E1D7